MKLSWEFFMVNIWPQLEHFLESVDATEQFGHGKRYERAGSVILSKLFNWYHERGAWWTPNKHNSLRRSVMHWIESRWRYLKSTNMQAITFTSNGLSCRIGLSVELKYLKKHILIWTFESLRQLKTIQIIYMNFSNEEYTTFEKTLKIYRFTLASNLFEKRRF